MGRHGTAWHGTCQARHGAARQASHAMPDSAAMPTKRPRHDTIACLSCRAVPASTVAQRASTSPAPPKNASTPLQPSAATPRTCDRHHRARPPFGGAPPPSSTPAARRRVAASERGHRGQAQPRVDVLQPPHGCAHVLLLPHGGEESEGERVKKVGT